MPDFGTLNSMPPAAVPGVFSFLSHAWVWENRFLLTPDTVDYPQYEKLLSEAHAILGLNRVYPYCGAGTLVEQLFERSTVEPRLYDVTVPPGWGGYIDLCPGYTALALLYTVPGRLLELNAQMLDFVRLAYADKNDPYSMKAFYFESLEWCWSGVTLLPECAFIHHLQLNGILKPRLTARAEKTVYRHLLNNTLAQLAPRHSAVLVPTGRTYVRFTDQYSQGQMVVPQRPYDGDVFDWRFARISGAEVQERYPQFARQCVIFQHLPLRDIEFWSYKT